MSLGEALTPVWNRFRRACGVGAPALSRPSPQRMQDDRSTECRDRRLDQLERIYMAANAGLWGDISVMVAVAEMLERDRFAETRSER